MARRTRLLAPVAVAGLIAAGAAVVPNLTASAAPKLPPMSASRLLARVASSHVSHLSGTVKWTADLGLPSISGLSSGGNQSVPHGSAFKPSSLLSGSHTFRFWVAGRRQQRVAIPGSLQESDFLRVGRQAWLWNSGNGHVTHLRLASPSSAAGRAADRSAAPQAALSPQAVADRIVRGLHRGATSVSVSSPQWVAGRSAYVLRLSPDRSVAANQGSTVSSVNLAVDASTGLPLQVSVYARGQAAPALQVGFTSVSLSKPPASVFAVPHGTTTSSRVIHPAAPHLGALGGSAHGPKPTVVGADWGRIVELSLPAASGAGNSAQLRAAATPVSGSWGSGRLLRSSLLNALLLPDGHVLVGFTTPAALEQAAGTAGH